jgi:hypothetical protein
MRQLAQFTPPLVWTVKSKQWYTQVPVARPKISTGENT